MASRLALASALLVCLAVLAGCSSKGTGAADPSESVPVLSVDSSTGGIRGVVVDQALKPLKGVTVSVTGQKTPKTTMADGAFTFSGLKAGTYIVRATHPVYDPVQVSVDVVAGVADPKAVKIQLQRVIAQDPFYITAQFNGYIACSVGVPNVGYSEECGAGVGVDCIVPVVGCQRVGGQGNNIVQNDFYVDNTGVKAVIAELYWEPSTGGTGSGELYTMMATNFACAPECGYDDKLAEASGKSPLYLRADDKGLEAIQKDPTIRISTFTWASADGTTPNVAADQPFQEFTTIFYYATAPEGWSFINNSPNPFA